MVIFFTFHASPFGDDALISAISSSIPQTTKENRGKVLSLCFGAVLPERNGLYPLDLQGLIPLELIVAPHFHPFPKSEFDLWSFAIP